MAYGISVNTTNGMVDSTNLNLARLVFSTTLAGASGTVSVPGFDSNGGFFVFRATDGPLHLTNFDFNNTTKVFSWSANAGGSSPTAFRLMGLRYD